MIGAPRGTQVDDRLCVQHAAILLERVLHQARFAHLFMPPYDRMIARFVQLDAIATTILRHATGGLRGGERVLKGFRAGKRHDAEAHGDAALLGGKIQMLDGMARLLGPDTRLIERMSEQHGRIAVAGQMRREATRGQQPRLPQAADVADDAITGAKTSDFVDHVEPVEIGIDDAGRIRARCPKRDFVFKRGPAQESRTHIYAAVQLLVRVAARDRELLELARQESGL